MSECATGAQRLCEHGSIAVSERVVDEVCVGDGAEKDRHGEAGDAPRLAANELCVDFEVAMLDPRRAEHAPLKRLAHLSAKGERALPPCTPPPRRLRELRELEEAVADGARRKKVYERCVRGLEAARSDL